MGNLRTIGIHLDRGYREDLNWNFQKVEQMIVDSEALAAETKQELRADLDELRRQLNLLNIDEILALLQQIQTKITEANTAAILATEKANAANTAATNANTKATLADSKATFAQEKGDYATEKAVLANEAATRANQEASNLSQLKVDVVDATQAANEATGKANTAASNANTATEKAASATSKLEPLLPNVQGLVNTGSYVNTTPYKKNNIVEYNGSSFQALEDTVGNPPPVLPVKSNEFWMLVAQRGVDGEGSVSTVNGKAPNVNGNIDLTAVEIGAIEKIEKGVANGIPTLDANKKIPVAQIPDSVGKVQSVNGQTGDVVISVFSGNYNDLSNKPVIPTKTSQLTNDSTFETTAGAQTKANQAETNAKAASIPTAQKGAANGVASLGANGKVPAAQLDVSTLATKTELTTHTGNTAIHVTQAEKDNWNSLALRGSDIGTGGTFYVDGENGTDAVGKGTSEGSGAFETIQYAVNQLKKINTDEVIINIAYGTYDEDVEISGFFGGKITLRSDYSSTTIKSLKVSNISRFGLSVLSFSEYISLLHIQHFQLHNVNRTASTFYTALAIQESKGVVSSSQFSNTTSGASAVKAINSELLLDGVTGTNNSIGVHSISSTIRKGEGTTITGNQPHKLEFGGTYA
ncbi:MAG: hypothetical protein ACI35R_13340 [Bacillus sp. (in: firmicutes)]